MNIHKHRYSKYEANIVKIGGNQLLSIKNLKQKNHKTLAKSEQIT